MLLLAVGVAGLGGVLAVPQANASGACVNAHVEANGTVLVDQHPCVTVPEAPAPTLPGLPS
jgi:hypothetical protein